MGNIKYSYEILEQLFYEHKVITLPMMKQTLDVENKMTIFRKLKHLPYKASYSHLGKYYTLDTIANYDEQGLWSYNDIFFSKHGSLLNTLEQLITHSEFGFYSQELEKIVHVRVFNALQKLFNQHKIYRIQHGGRYLYLSPHDWQKQLTKRRKNLEHAISLTFNTVGKSEAVVNSQQCLLKLLQLLNEKQRRLLAGFLSLCIGRGGDKLLSEITEMNVKTIAKGKRELKLEHVDMDKVRASGGGRKAIKKTNILNIIEKILDDDTAGDPCNRLRYTRKSTYKLSEQLELFDFYICANTTGKLMKELGYSLKVNRKIIPEVYHPHRNEQFDIINRKKKGFNANGYPILSIDTKKKELVGNFKNNGNAWRKHQDDVYIHDFPSLALGKAIPHGLYEPITNKGTVVVGTSHETAEFAVDSIELWLTQIAWKRYQNMAKLLIYCDSGGSNGYRCRAWKYFLYEKICKPYDIEITVCHYPSGASKWNPVEHRMFSFISKNWEGIPLRTYDTVLEYIRSTTTKTGLEIDAYLNDNEYETGIKIDDKQMKTINIIKDDILPNWNYSIVP